MPPSACRPHYRQGRLETGAGQETGTRRGRDGLVVDAVVLPASAHDNAAGSALLDGVAAQCDTVAKALVDQRPAAQQGDGPPRNAGE